MIEQRALEEGIQDSEGYLNTGYSKEIVEAFVGDNREYYIYKWGNATDPGSFAGWNWAAVFGGMFWLGYRKLYKLLAIIWGVEIVSAFLQFRYDIGILGFAIQLVLGAGANSMYFNEMKKRMKKLEQQKAGEELTIKDVSAIGGASDKGIGIGLLFMVSYVALAVAMGMAFLN